MVGGSSPRVWGIRHLVPYAHVPPLGSSPRVWGIPVKQPAPLPWRPVHPHVCGEYGKTRTRYACSKTVHPHVCGEYLVVHYSFVALHRFIPTCVGNTQVESEHASFKYGSSPRVWGIPQPWTDSDLHSTVHPHVCGEYLNVNAIEFMIGGSSPRVWGIPHAAGVTNLKLAVHPHVCGEYAVSKCNHETHSGSSPRVWGIRDCMPTQTMYPTVHPHVCGEYLCQACL